MTSSCQIYFLVGKLLYFDTMCWILFVWVGREDNIKTVSKWIAWLSILYQVLWHLCKIVLTIKHTKIMCNNENISQVVWIYKQEYDASFQLQFVHDVISTVHAVLDNLKIHVGYITMTDFNVQRYITVINHNRQTLTKLEAHLAIPYWVFCVETLSWFLECSQAPVSNPQASHQPIEW